MKTFRIGIFLLILAAPALMAASAAPVVAFDWFEYSGHDDVYQSPLPAGEFHNPILAGYYPDPAITRVGNRFYLVNSSFVHWPGVPVHESTDLVHWKLLGHVLDDPRQVSFDNLGASRGVYAPSIGFHDGYVLRDRYTRGCRG